MQFDLIAGDALFKADTPANVYDRLIVPAETQARGRPILVHHDTRKQWYALSVTLVRNYYGTLTTFFENPHDSRELYRGELSMAADGKAKLAYPYVSSYKREMEYSPAKLDFQSVEGNPLPPDVRQIVRMGLNPDATLRFAVIGSRYYPGNLDMLRLYVGSSLGFEPLRMVDNPALSDATSKPGTQLRLKDDVFYDVDFSGYTFTELPDRTLHIQRVHRP